ncbi:MAG: hypothetical protein ABIZ49_07285, partial [Opitutaceae bacterium]
MKIVSLKSALLLLAAAGSLRAQPVEALRGALDHLFASGNYGWRETRQTEVNGRSSITPFGIG